MCHVLRTVTALVVLLLPLSARADPPDFQDAPGASKCVRVGTRIVVASSMGAGWQVALDCGRAEWKAEEDSTDDAQTLGKRFRLGSDFWASLDSAGSVTIGGKEIKAGYWYLALERSKKGEWFLVALDAEPLRKKRIDPSKSAETSGGTLVPLKDEKLAPPARQLDVEFVPVVGKPFEWTLEIRFGPHRLAAGVTLKT
jgi:hypothetical protein